MKKSLKLKKSIIRNLSASDMRFANGGEPRETEPYSFCGLCHPITYISCNSQCTATCP